ncbi:MAG: DNA-processing protein DprA [Alistipes ihumii]
MTVDDIALTMHPEIGSRTAIHLVECFGSAERLFAATQQEIVLRSGLKPELARSISRREYHGAAERELAFVERHRIRAIDACSAEYPRRLKECPDYPHVIYVSGGTDLNSSRWLSVVGTRRMTPYGAMLCERLIGELAALVPDAGDRQRAGLQVDIEARRRR